MQNSLPARAVRKLACAWGHTLVPPGSEVGVPGEALLPLRGCPDGRVRPRTWAPLHLIDKPVLLCGFLSLVTDSEDDGESEAAKQLIQPIAEKIIAKYKAKEEEAPLLFFVAGEVSAAGAPRAGSAGRPLQHE